MSELHSPERPAPERPAPERPAAAPAPAEGIATIDVEAVNAKAKRTLYKAREPIYPKKAEGKFRIAKSAFMVISLAAYYIMPWVRWPRDPGEPTQATLVDVENSRFYFFGLEIWPQEIYFITGLLLMGALGLFLITALFGRVWCGYACPQTVWTDLFITVERMIEGDRNARIKLARAPWSLGKVRKKITKHIVWLLIAFATGGAWILYFHDAPTLAREFFVGQAPFTAYFFAGILTFTTYALAGTMREQVCTYMCPWPRIQGAMTDKETIEVTYRSDRGEPRGPHKKGESWDGRGDCIDCKLCVAVCPMGIDIRDGDQLECIHCALCIDACDEVMLKVGRPTGLITYDSAMNHDLRVAGQKPRWRLVRPRTVFYATVLAMVSAAMLWGLANRTEASMNVLHERNPSYVRLSDGSVQNGYEIKLLNKTSATRDMRLTVDGPEGLGLRVVGQPGAGLEPVLSVWPDQAEPFQVYLTLPKEALTEPKLPVTFTVTPIDGGEPMTVQSVFQTGVNP